jgi:tape measure domain-containing protein
MSQNIGDFEATIRMIMSTPDANKAIADAKALNDAYETLSKKSAGARSSELLKQQESTFKSTAATLLQAIEQSSATVLELASRLQAAGIPLSNLNSYAQQLAHTVSATSKAIVEMNKGFFSPNNAYKQNPFTIQNQGVLSNLVVDSSKALTPLLRNAEVAWNTASKLVQAQKGAVDSVSNLLSGQQKLASSLGAVGNANDPLSQKVRETESSVEKLKKLVADYTNTMRGFGANTTIGGIGIGAGDALRRAEEAMRGLGAAQRVAAAGSAVLNGGLADMLAKFGQLSMFASGPIASLLGRLSAFSFLPNVGGGIIAAVAGLSTATIGMTKFLGEAIRVERTLGPVRELFLQLAKVTGEDGKRAFDETTASLVKYGIGIDSMIKPMARLMIASQGTILGGSNFKDFVDSFAAIGSKFALPEEAMAGIAKAFEQMLSKGTVQMEELKNQLGDRFPAALRIALMAYREMSGQADASMEDFMEASKKRSIDSALFIDTWINKTKQVFGVNTEATDNLNSTYGRLSGSYTMMITGLDQALGATTKWKSLLDGLVVSIQYVTNNAQVIGPITAAAFGVTAVAGVVRLLNYFGLVEGKLLSMRAKIALVAAAAAGMMFFSEGASAAERGTAAIVARAQQLSAEMEKSGKGFEKWGQTGEVLGDIQNRMNSLKALIPQLQEQIDKQGGTWKDSLLSSTGDSAADKARRTMFGLLGVDATADLSTKLEQARSHLEKLRIEYDKLAPKQKEFEADTRATADALGNSDSEAEKHKKALEGIGASIAELKKKNEILQSGGLEGVEAFEGYTNILKHYGLTAKDAGADVIAAAKSMADAQNKFDEDKKRLQSQDRKNNRLTDGGDLSRAQGIIERANSIMEGSGLVQGNLIRKNIKEHKEYQDALMATGVSFKEASTMAEEFRAALDMQLAGINVASMQMKQWSALQKGLESFSDSLADLMTSGQMNSRNFANAFKNMTNSIIKDMIAMSLKAYVMKPLLAGLFGSLGGGGGDVGLGSWMPTITGARARGGAVNAGDSYLVGENGPEVLTAPFSGNILSNKELNTGSEGGITLHMTNNFYGSVGSSEVDEFKTQLPGIVLGIVRDAKKRTLV